MKTNGKLICMKSLLVAVVLTCLAAGTASAQARYTGKVTLPFEVRWGKTILPAGDYRFRIAPGGSLLTSIQSIHGKVSGFAMPVAMQDVPFSDADSLLLTNDGSRWQVREVRLASQGRTLDYEPRIRHAKREVEQAQSEMAVLIHAGE